LAIAVEFARSFRCYCFASWLVLSPDQVRASVPAVLVWAIANVVVYQPWPLDSTKVLYAGWIPLAVPVVATFLLEVWKSLLMLLAVPTVMVMTFSSFLSDSYVIVGATQTFAHQDFDLGFWIAENTNRKAIFVTAEYGNHPIHALAGRQNFLTSAAWAMSHGIDVHTRVHESEVMCDFADDVQIFEANHTDYIVLHDSHYSMFAPSNDGFRRQVYYSSGYTIYSCREQTQQRTDSGRRQLRMAGITGSAYFAGLPDII
jgi:hypothetical protein